MKGKPKQKNTKKRGAVLGKYKAAVSDFVRLQSGTEEEEYQRHPLELVKKKSRKELRKEKRKLKKAKMKCHYEGKKFDGETAVADNAPPRTKAQREAEAKPKQKTDISPKSTKTKKNKNKLQESRKKALLEANEQEDKEIKKLEKCLRLNKRKNKKTLPQSFVADGLDYILGVIDSGSQDLGMYESDDNMDAAKDNFEKLDENDPDLSDDSESLDNEMACDESDEEVDSDENDGNEEDNEEEDTEDEISQSNSEESEEEKDEEVETANIQTPDPVAPADGKYIPPHLRNIEDDKRKAELEKLKKNVKGLVNRLSEANMAYISGQLEELYMSRSRKDMNDTLTEVLLSACVTPTLMPDRLLMEHVLLISVIHHCVGLEVGAQFLETVVRKFDKFYQDQSEDKECNNLVAIIAHLYNFHVVHSLLIFDILKRLLATFTEKDIELVLFVLRNVGFALRKDDALALKELIVDAQRKASEAGARFQDQTRVRFMLETMMALKNNDMRKIPGYDPEPVEKLRKLQRTLINRSASGSDMKLRVSLENLLSADQVGRWWIVGSSWSGAPMINEEGKTSSKDSSVEGQFSNKVLELARKQRMNTDVRRNIFCVLMTSEDYLDAFEKLLRMGLKDKQEREIVHVLMHCCLQEKTFNAFYAVLGEKFCSHDRRFQMTFQFCLWDKFREIANLSSSTFNNLIQLVTLLLQKKCLSLSILKVIEFGELDKPKVRFLRQVLTKLLKETQPADLVTIFGRISGIPKLGMLREGLKLFISHFLLKNAQSQDSPEQAAMLLERAQLATRAMDAKEAKLKL
ncbi:nucleolar MIF4G domain-containing protein 1 [Synchiropus splendidus]|uniref:nucleolar MIF4G domain-containing protein 1 n=1 Tax=Synchiropus splendidus TaxID=270530 RepID=UPI00237DDD5E|nr:nucleolar MIF4G domain-containing protein 1 [Synchiropus splendidus]